jgi:hypothetical protein
VSRRAGFSFALLVMPIVQASVRSRSHAAWLLAVMPMRIVKLPHASLKYFFEVDH